VAILRLFLVVWCPEIEGGLTVDTMLRMNPILLDGKMVSQAVLMSCAERVKRIVASSGITPCLATILVGDDPASATYVKMKGKRCEEVGMKSLRVALPADTTTEQLVAKVRELGADPAVSGILLQHPVPRQIDERAAFEAIPAIKDVDGVTLHSFAAVSLLGFTHSTAGGTEPIHGACTPAGIMRLLHHYKVELKGKHAVVIGRSPILGKPMAAMLLNADCTVTVCHSRTRNLPEVVKSADLVVAALGKPKFVQGDWIKPGAIVVDAGYSAGNIGDADFDACSRNASMITPVPGGVGPMTIATLIDQTSLAAEWLLCRPRAK
jgi:methylenetetrahydrofolate dehydrogenase (NADP+)/methenyltetrahydrofolate cyclohydrolase